MESENRIRLFDEFIPKDGYLLKEMLCCSYGVDPSILITLLLYSMGEVDEAFIAGELDSAGKEKLRECLKENIDKLTALTCKEAPKMGKDIGTSQLIVTRSIGTLTEGTKGHGTFHPKIILAIYENEEDKSVYARCYFGSKNISLSNSLEFGSVFELVKNGEDISSMFKFLSQEKGISKRQAKRVQSSDAICGSFIINFL